MNGIMMMAIGLVVLIGAYLIYGRYLQNKWGIDPNAKTPAYEMEDGVDYVPADTNVVFGHQFASIAGAGPINGPIQAAIFGWLPVLLWILIGGVFFGAVQDFAAMYASVKNKGKRDGATVVQLYVSKEGDTEGPVKTLRGYRRVEVKAGKAVEVRIPIDDETFLWWNPETGRMNPMHGSYMLHYGDTSADAGLKTVKFVY